MLYHEIADFRRPRRPPAADISGDDPRDQSTPDISTTINLPASITAATRYTYDGNWDLPAHVAERFQPPDHRRRAGSGAGHQAQCRHPVKATTDCHPGTRRGSAWTPLAPTLGSNVWYLPVLRHPEPEVARQPGRQRGLPAVPAERAGPVPRRRGRAQPRPRMAANVHIWTYGSAHQPAVDHHADGRRVLPVVPLERAWTKCLDIEGGPGATSNAALTFTSGPSARGTNQQWTLQAP